MLTEAAPIPRHDARARRAWLTVLVSAPLVAFCIVRFGAGVDGLVPNVLVPVLVLLSIIDLEERRIPNRVVVPATAVMLALQLATQPDRALEWLLAPLAAALFLLLPLLVYPGGMGMGDVKLTVLLGAALGQGVAVALVVASVTASIAAFVLIARGGLAARRSSLPFGPFLALGALAGLLAAEGVIPF